MSSCAAFTSNLSMWSPMSSIYFDHNNDTAGGGITQAASPTFQYTVHDYFYQEYDESRYFHHEPVVYPSACIVCGLPHHPVPHTIMNDQVAQATYILESTPAPSKPTNARKKQRNHLKTASHDLAKKQKKKQDWVLLIRGLFYRWLSVCQNSIRPSRRRRHNIYPVKKA